MDETCVLFIVAEDTVSVWLLDLSVMADTVEVFTSLDDGFDMVI